MSVVAIIPARYGSTRLPGKPLAEIGGKPMIQHVYESASKARVLDRVMVATDDQRIVDAVRAFGGEVMLTAAHHASGTDRLAEVARKVKHIVTMLPDGPDVELVLEGGEMPWADRRKKSATRLRPRSSVRSSASCSRTVCSAP